MLNNFKLKVIPDETEELTEETKLRFVNRNKNSSKCVSELEKQSETPSLFPKLNKPKPYFSQKEIQNTTLSPIKIKQSVNKNSPLSQNKTKSSTVLTIKSNQEEIDKTIIELMKKGTDFDEVFETLKSQKLIGEEEDCEEGYFSD